MSKTATTVLVVIIVAAIGAVAYFKVNNRQTNEPAANQAAGNITDSLVPTDSGNVNNPETTDDSLGVDATVNGGVDADVDVNVAVREFTVNGSSFEFDPSEIRVKQGDKVRVTFNNLEALHDWRIDELGIATQQLSAGQSETVEFVASQAGTFEYYCSIGMHRQLGMVGKLIVE